MTPLMVAVLASVTLGNGSDTTLVARSGGRLEVNNFSGSVSVSTWARDAVRVRVQCGPRTDVEVDDESGGYSISAGERHGNPGPVEYNITAPAWMPVDISGPMNDVQIDGSKASVKVDTVNGDVTLRGGSGDIELSSVQGGVDVTGASGHMKLSAINQGVTASHISGQAEVETVNGDILLDDVQLDQLDASSVSGNLWFRGALRDNGRYQLETHAGDIQVVMADQPSARVTVSTYSGELSSDFEIGLKRLNSKEDVAFTLGNGSARLGLESFSGRIQLLKASDVEAMRKSLKTTRPEKGKESKNKDKSDDSDQ
ncbi:MAG: DUF4097 family beta strand repeat-containing protein [Candidatus Eiseniibacteriota bacterium]